MTMITSADRPASGAQSQPTVLDSSAFDLQSFFIVQQGNLAVAHEAQAVLAEAAHTIAHVQYRYAEHALADARTMFAANPWTGMAELLAVTRDAAARSASVAQEIFDLAYHSQRRARELLSRRISTNVDEFRLLLG